MSTNRPHESNDLLGSTCPGKGTLLGAFVIGADLPSRSRETGKALGSTLDQSRSVLAVTSQQPCNVEEKPHIFVHKYLPQGYLLRIF